MVLLTRTVFINVSFKVFDGGFEFINLGGMFIYR